MALLNITSTSHVWNNVFLLATVVINITVFKNVTPCSLVYCYLPAEVQNVI